MTVLRNIVRNVGTNVIANVNGSGGSPNGSRSLILPESHWFYRPSGVDNLNPLLTINGTTVEPKFRYKLGDANATNLVPWGYGETLTAVGSGGTFNAGSPGLGPNDDSANSAGTRLWAATGTSFADIAAEDFVLELIVEFDTSGKRIISKRQSGAASTFDIYGNASAVSCFLSDGSNTATITTANFATNAFQHLILFVDKSGSAQWYANGVVSGSAVSVASITSFTSGGTFRISADNLGGNPWTKRIAYCAMWAQSSWLDTHLQAAIAKKRHLQWSGMWPYRASGTKVPNTSTRAFAAYLDKVESGYRKLCYMGGEHLRMCHRQDKNGVNVRGYLPETQATNLITYSEDFSTWTLIDSGDVVIDNAAICPDGRAVAASIAGDSTDGQHGVRTSATLTAATYAYSAFYKPGNKTWARLQNSDIANGWCDFDCGNGVVGTAAAGCTGYIEGPFYSGDATPYYRLCIVFTGYAGTNTLRLQPIDADTDHSFAGDGSTVNCYVWGAQVEAGDYMTSPIITAGATATRLRDQLQVVAGANIGGEDRGQGTQVFDVLFPDFNLQTARYLASIDDGGATADRFFSIVGGTNDDFQFGSRASGGNDGDVLMGAGKDIVNGVKHTLRATWKTNVVKAYDNEIPGTPDTTADMPDDIDRINIGMSHAAASQAGCLISNYRIYDVPTTEGDV